MSCYNGINSNKEKQMKNITIIVTVNSHKYGVETFKMVFSPSDKYRTIEATVNKTINAGYVIGDVISSSWKEA